MANAIQNSQILELLGAAIDEYCINQFNIKRDSKGNILPWRSISILDWEDLGGYCSAKLLAYSCQAMMHIANLSTRNQKAAYDFGHNLQLIWNVSLEHKLEFSIFSSYGYLVCSWRTTCMPSLTLIHINLIWFRLPSSFIWSTIPNFTTIWWRCQMLLIKTWWANHPFVFISERFLCVYLDRAKNQTRTGLKQVWRALELLRK